MKRFYRIICGLVITGAFAAPVMGQTVKGSNGSATTLTPLKAGKKTVKSLVGDVNGTVKTDYVKSPNDYFVVEFSNMPKQELQEALKSAAQVVAYIPDRMYLFSSADATKGLAAVTQVVAGQLTVKTSGVLAPQFKLDNEIYALYSKKEAVTEKIKSNGVIVSTYQNTDLPALTATLTKWGLSYEGELPNAVRVKGLDLAAISSLAAIPYVSGLFVYEEPEAVAEQELMYIMQPNGIEIVNYERRGPIGNGVYFVNWETYGREPFYAINTAGRNVAGLTDYSTNAHGTNCGLIVSAANNTNEYQSQGMAPGVMNLAANGSVTTYGNMQAAVEPLIKNGYAPLVSNHSVGWARAVDQYDANAQLIDYNTYTYNNYMCCYPTGNWAEGKNTYGIYTIPDYGTISGNIKTNKNGIAIHSTIYPGVDVAWANFGPTQDGRMKPEICAQGSGGTSYASPGVAGLFAVLMEQFKTTYPDKNMFIDVCKAVMLNTAMDVRTYDNDVEGSFGIDYRTGFGHINPKAAVESISDKRVEFENSVGQGGVYEKTITVPAGQIEFRAMLYWNDPPATVGAYKTLVNDLDLVVIAPDGTEILPWTLDPSATTVTLPATRSENHRDNVEQVVITASKKGETLQAGEYTIRVKGYSVSSTQRFVITWQSRARGIIMTSIPEGYRLAPGQEVFITWDMTVTSSEDTVATNFTQGAMTPKVYYRTSPSASWTEATPGTGTQYWYTTSNYRTGTIFGKNFFKFVVPSTMAPTSQLQFRIVADDLEAISNNATVAERLTARPDITMFTPDSVRLSWTAATGATTGKYLIYALTDKYMEVVDSVDMPATVKTVAAPAGKTWKQSDLFAVAAFNGTASALGQRTAPSGLDATNTEITNSADQWDTSYLLCLTDTLPLSAGRLEGIVQWYRDSVAVAAAEGGNDRTLRIPSTKPGRYYYTVSVEGYSTPVFSSVSTTVNEAALSLNDTTVWGDYAWKGYVFRDPNGNPASLPLMKEGLGLYGKFDLAPLAFVSKDTLFDSTKKEMIQTVEGYIGCDFATSAYNEQLVVLRRKGFVPGNYTFTLSGITGRVVMTFKDGEGNIVGSKTSGVNSASESAYTVRLDANSTAEIEWLGAAMSLAVSTYLDGLSAPVPGNQRSGLGFWLSPDSIAGNDGEYVTRLFNTYPNMNILNSIVGNAAKINRTGSNYNTTLDLQGNGLFLGGLTSTTTSNVTDIIVLKPEATGSSRRFVSYGSYASTNDYDNYESYVASELGSTGTYIGAMRNNVLLTQTKAKNNLKSIVTLRQNTSENSMLVDGSTVAASLTPLGGSFKIERMAIGGNWGEPAKTTLMGRARIAEILHYNTKLTAAQENRVRSMLAVKHSITLDHDYISSTSKVVYSVADDYNKEIVGIGRDDNSALNQRQSISMTASGSDGLMLLSIGDLAETNSANTAAFANNQTYYIVGSNGKTARLRHSGTSIGTREWRMHKTSTGSESINMYFVPSKFNIANYTPFMEVSHGKAFTSNAALGVDTELLPFGSFTAPDGITYMSVAVTPTDTMTYLRIVWQPTTAVESATADATQGASVRYEASTSSVEVDVAGATALTIIDGAGRIMQTAELSADRSTVKTTLAPGIYVVSVKRTGGKADYNQKINIGGK